jgi:site-specific recombinase XerC
MQAPVIKDVIKEYLSHLRAQCRSPKTITKYEFCFKLMLELAARRRITHIDQIDLAFVDAFKLENGF